MVFVQSTKYNIDIRRNFNWEKNKRNVYLLMKHEYTLTVKKDELGGKRRK